jgi:hypothetical protein
MYTPVFLSHAQSSALSARLPCPEFLLHVGNQRRVIQSQLRESLRTRSATRRSATLTLSQFLYTHTLPKSKQHISLWKGANNSTINRLRVYALASCMVREVECKVSFMRVSYTHRTAAMLCAPVKKLGAHLWRSKHTLVLVRFDTLCAVH